MEELNVKKTKYFVIAIIILIILGVLLIIHFNNKEMVKGDIKDSVDTTTTTTTEKITTTTKKRVKVEEVSNVVVEEVIYKSVIDEENKLVYNYKLTDEITESDKLISKKLELNDIFKNNNIIGLYDISLYDSNMNKKIVTNSLINIKIPLTSELIGYDEYKVVYINDNNEITNELFEVKVDSDYIEFNTTHLSMFGIVGIKKVVEEEKEVVDLSDVTIDVNVNDVKLEGVTNILLDKDDKVEFIVNNIDESYKYDIYYALKGIDENIEYKLFEGNLDLISGNKYTLVVKVVVEDTFKVFELGNIGLYDIVFTYDKEEKLLEDKEIGTIVGEDTTNPNSESNLNDDIVIDYVEKEEPEITTNNDKVDNSVNNNSETNNSDNNDINNNNNDISNSATATIKLNGNIYLVEKTDISKLEMTGYLYIDTSEDIIFGSNDSNELLTSNLYMIIIRSKEFTLNGNKYRYEYVGEDLIIKKVEVSKDETETEIETEVDVTDSFTNIFANDYKVWHTEDGLNIANPA